MKNDRRIKGVYDRGAARGYRAAKAPAAGAGARGDSAAVFQPAHGGGVRALDQALHPFLRATPPPLDRIEQPRAAYRGTQPHGQGSRYRAAISPDPLVPVTGARFS